MDHFRNLSRRTLLGGMALTLGAPSLVWAKSKSPRQSGRSRLVTYSPEPASEPVTVEVLLRGNGPLIVLLPSLGRGASDFDDLASRIAAAGYRTAAINPRGIGRSTGPRARPIGALARDVKHAIDALQARRGVRQAKPVVLIGHAYGNRLARAVASEYPEAVSSLILLASGGQVPIPPDIAKALADVFDPALSPAAHIAAVRTAFFAPGNDPEVWRDGWYGAVAMQQQVAIRSTPQESWTAGGKAPIYIIQAAQDVLAPPANAQALRAAHPDRVSIAILDNAGHAILPEQPHRLAQLVIDRLAAQSAANGH